MLLSLQVSTVPLYRLSLFFPLPPTLPLLRSSQQDTLALPWPRYPFLTGGIIPDMEEREARSGDTGGGEEAEAEARGVASNEEFPVGGRLFHFRHNWTFSPWAHSIVSSGLGWQWTVPKEDLPKFKSFPQHSTPLLEAFVKELLDKKAIKKANSFKFQARLFLVDKKGTEEKRVIMDLSKINKVIRCDKFKMLTIANIRTLLPRYAYTVSIDLKDAYWHVPIARHMTPYLGFALGKRKFTFKVMPFGLNIAPQIFTKLGKAVLE